MFLSKRIHSDPLTDSSGNAWCAAVWLGNYNKNSNPVDLKDDEKVKEFIVAKVCLLVNDYVSELYTWCLLSV